MIRISTVFLALLATLALFLSATAATSPKGVVLCAVKVRAVEGDTPPLYDLRLISYPSGKARSLYARTPMSERPEGIIRNAKLLDHGATVLFVVDTFWWDSPERGGINWCEVWQLDVHTGKLKRLLKDVELSQITPSPDRTKAFVGPGWWLWSRTGFRQLKPSKGYAFSSLDTCIWPYGSPGPVVPYMSKKGDSMHAADPKTGNPIVSWNPESEEAATGRRLVVRHAKNSITLATEGSRKATVCRIDTRGYSNFQSLMATISPDGRFAAWFTGWVCSGAMTSWGGECYIFDLSGRKPRQLKMIEDADPDLFIGWSRTIPGFYFRTGKKVRLERMPSLSVQDVMQLPPHAAFRDLVEDAK